MVAHGQMRERELEERMHALHPRRGRRAALHHDHRERPRHSAGQHDPRSTAPMPWAWPSSTSCAAASGAAAQRAYAYLLVPAQLERSATRRAARLEAIQDLTELGSGFRLANLDLEIRGAGDLLGGRAVAATCARSATRPTWRCSRRRSRSCAARLHEEVDRPGDPAAGGGATARGLRPGREPAPGSLQAALERAGRAHEVALIRDELLDRFGAHARRGREPARGDPAEDRRAQAGHRCHRDHAGRARAQRRRPDPDRSRSAWCSCSPMPRTGCASRPITRSTRRRRAPKAERPRSSTPRMQP